MKFRLLIIVALFAANVMSALLVVKVRHDNRTNFVELQSLQETRDELQVQWGQLQLEQSAWATHGRIERTAREQLDMVIVDNRDVVVLRNGQTPE